jgi:hypothetical protein
MYICYVLVVMLGEAQREYIWASMQFLAWAIIFGGLWLAPWLGYPLG